MCGIAGIVAREPVRDRTALAAMGFALRHRGPDDHGEWWSGDSRVGLAHRRLAIIDLSAAGHQPMVDCVGGAALVFNGEIYNYRELRRILESAGHRFVSDSDTEVVLKAYAEWGDDCVSRFDGMFAIAIVDGRRRRMVLARDRAGEKPLYYRHADGAFAFASELKGLLALPSVTRRLNPQALDAFLAYGYVPGDLCIIDGVRKLPAAHILVLDLETMTAARHCYWTIPEPARGPEPGESVLLDELDGALEAAVRRQLVADVPVGILLSGGIDSGLVTAMASRVSGSPVRTFTLTVPGHTDLDEARLAASVARHCGTIHHELPAESFSFDRLEILARQFDEPLADSSVIPTFLVSRLIREHATVALGGDGGDELFAGYPHYRWLQRQAAVRRVVPRQVRAPIAALAHALPVGMRGRNHLIGFGDGIDRSIAHLNLYFDAPGREALSPMLRRLQGPRAESLRVGFSDSDDVVRRASVTDFRTTLVDGYLVKVDRASMLNSLEIRAPFLDHGMLDFAFGRVPSDAKIRSGVLKALPRGLAARLLPAGIATARKRGFAVPLRAWFDAGWDRAIEDTLRDGAGGLLDWSAVSALIAGQRAGYNNMQRLFALTMLELWRREYGVTL